MGKSGGVPIHIKRERRRKLKEMVEGLQSDCALPLMRTALWSLPLTSVKSEKTSSARIWPAGESTPGPEQGSNYVISNPANSWDLQKVPGTRLTIANRITVRSLKGRNHNGAVVAIREASQFMDIARSIGKDISSTYTKLEKLSLLAKRKTIFDDKPAEIQKLAYIIKQGTAPVWFSNNPSLQKFPIISSRCWKFEPRT